LTAADSSVAVEHGVTSSTSGQSESMQIDPDENAFKTKDANLDLTETETAVVDTEEVYSYILPPSIQAKATDSKWILKRAKIIATALR
jgi:hypothetical protein